MSRFTVHKSDGTTIALVADVLDAQKINRETAHASYVLRVSDGALIAQKTARGKGLPASGEMS